MGEKGRLTRGALLKGAGAALVLVAGGGAWRAEERDVFGAGEGPAFEPWKEWRAEGEEGALALVSAAVLASNAHNTQPWLFRVSGSRIDVFADEKRDIGAVDPFSREMHVGLGCALENLLLAARARGYEYRLTTMPDRSDPAFVARVDLSGGEEEVSPLYEAIPERHTNRYAYDASRPVPAAALEALSALNEDGPGVEVSWFATRAERRKVGGLLSEAAKAITDDEEQSYDNGERWLRQGEDAIREHRDGLTLDTMGISGLSLLAAKLLPAPSARSSDEFWLQSLERQTATAGAFGILSVRDYEDAGWRLAAGRLWQRMHLWITKEGLAAQPMNQLHERADREAQLGTEPVFGRALQGLLGDPARRGIFTFRLGYPTRQAPPSPRRAIEDVRA